jgi:hypothetical protein
VRVGGGLAKIAPSIGGNLESGRWAGSPLPESRTRSKSTLEDPHFTEVARGLDGQEQWATDCGHGARVRGGREARG